MGEYSKVKIKKLQHPIYLVFAIMSALMGCNSPKEESREQAVYTTSVIVPESRTLEQSYPTTIQGRQDVDVFAQVTGKIVKVCVTEGQAVEKGQILFVIDPVPFQTAYNTAKANVSEARAKLATARMNYEANQKLYDAKIIASVEYRTSKNVFAQAQALERTGADSRRGNSRNQPSVADYDRG